MQTIILSLVIGFLIPVGISLTGIYHIALGIILGLILSIVLFVVFSRKISKDVMPKMEQAQRLMQNQNFKQAIELLESLRPYGKKMLLLEGQINALIGMIHYMQNKEDQAMGFLAKGTSRHWYAMIIYCYLLSKHKKDDEMVSKFEMAVRLSGKEPMLWNAYAFCLDRIGKKEDAIKVLNRAIKKLGENNETKINLNNLKNDKKLNMKAFGDMWYGLRIERAPRQMMKNPNHPGYRGFKQKKRMV